MDGHTWECTRCQARRYGQTTKLPEGWEWRVVYTVTGDRRTPTRYDARCGKCVGKEPPGSVAAPPSPKRDLPW